MSMTPYDARCSRHPRRFSSRGMASARVLSCTRAHSVTRFPSVAVWPLARSPSGLLDLVLDSLNGHHSTLASCRNVWSFAHLHVELARTSRIETLGSPFPVTRMTGSGPGQPPPSV